MARKKPMGVGIVGLGRAGWGMHGRELTGRERMFTIVAACDVETRRCGLMAERFGCRSYRNVKDLIADPGVELVDIASRSPEHVPHALLALKAGKSVFLEKPIALSYGEAKKLGRAVARSAGELYIRHNRRFEPAFQHIREIMASRILGDVFEIKLRRNGYQRRDDWQTLIRCGGGQLLNWGPHIIDHALRLLDAPWVDMWSDLKRVAAVGDAEDHLKIILKGENGRIVDLEISGGAALPEPEYLIYGSRGALRCEGDGIHLRYLDPRKKLARRRPKSSSPPIGGGFGGPDKLHWIEKTIKVNPRQRCSMDGIWDHVYAAMREGTPFPITLEQSLAVMEVVSKARKGSGFE